MRHPPPHLYRRAGLAAGVDPDTLDHAVSRRELIESRGAAAVLSLRHLAHLTGAPYLYLRDIVERAVDPYTDISLSKKSGGSRPISAPEPMLMDVQRLILDQSLAEIPLHPAAFAYRKGRSVVDCARHHAGARWLVKLDLHDFFGQISERQVYRVFRGRGYARLVSLELARICTRVRADWVRHVDDSRYPSIESYTVDAFGYLPQGGPTSGALANAVAAPMDYALAFLAAEHGFVYTRYSHDLVFSSGGAFDRDHATRFVGVTAGEVRKHGFTLHRTKTRIVPPGARLIVLGLLVDRDSVRLLPEFRRRIDVHIRGVSKFGLRAHADHRGFRSLFSLVNHVDGMLAFSLDVEPDWARRATHQWQQTLVAHGYPLPSAGG